MQNIRINVFLLQLDFLFSKQSMKEFGPCEMIYLSFTEWTTAHFCNPNNISMKAWAAVLSGHKTLC